MPAARSNAYLAIGSNIAPQTHIPRCLALLEAVPDTRILAVSAWYRTRPWGLADQPDFINLVVALQTALSPAALLAATQAIEQQLERVRQVKNGPRTIDIDLLLYDDQVISSGALQIPHPGLLERDFMLIPLIEIAPQAIHPGLGRPVSELQTQIRYQQIIERLAETASAARTAPAEEGMSGRERDPSNPPRAAG